jgi:hypothetical protein
LYHFSLTVRSPVLEEVICVHATEDGICEKCEKVREENEKHSYWVAGDWFEILAP